MLLFFSVHLSYLYELCVHAFWQCALCLLLFSDDALLSFVLCLRGCWFLNVFVLCVVLFYCGLAFFLIACIACVSCVGSDCVLSDCVLYFVCAVCLISDSGYRCLCVCCVVCVF